MNVLKAAGVVVVVMIWVLSLPLSASAYFYIGSDWGGQDLILSDGDSLSGNFTNVGLFSIPFDASIASNGNLSLGAGRVMIDGTLKSDPKGYDLLLGSASDLLLNGNLMDWGNVTLSAVSSIYLSPSGTISIWNGNGNVSPVPSGTLVLKSEKIERLGSTSSTILTPVPAAAWLLGSGLLCLAGGRRRLK